MRSEHDETRASPRVLAAADPTITPEDVGLSSQRLERISRAIQKSVADGRIAGGVSLVARHGKIAFFQAAGMADRDARKPMRTDSIFRICSMAKPITSAAVTMLYEEGRFELSDPVSDYLPEFKQVMLNGGQLSGVRILSRKSVELMSQNHLQGKPDGDDYGLGFGVHSDSVHLKELDSVGAYYWGGFYFTSFVIDPKEDLIAIFMGQLHPTGGLDLSSKAITLAYQAIKD